MTRFSVLKTLLVLHIPIVKTTVFAFSTPSSPNHDHSSNNNNHRETAASYTLFDRFLPECPANTDVIRRFDPSLLHDDGASSSSSLSSLCNEEGEVWVAVYRTSNNAPSVFIKDEFFNAMRLATGGLSELPPSERNEFIETSGSSSSSSNSSPANVLGGQNSKGQADSMDAVTAGTTTSTSSLPPVAVARLIPSTDFPGTYTLDQMRCSLKKETQDESCEGGSEHKEALSVAIDSLLMHYLTTENNSNQQQRHYEGAIRSKATLVGASLLEERGFVQVDKLSKDMATHTSSLDGGMEKYAQKYVESMTTKNQGARDRAEKILGLLGRLDRNTDMKAAAAVAAGNQDEDPWANVNII